MMPFLDELLKSPEDLVELNRAKEDERLGPLLDMICLIKDGNIQLFVRSVLLQADNFWSAKAFAHDSAIEDENTEGGLVNHTIRVVRSANAMANAFQIPTEETDILLAAALIHDVTKFIPIGNNSIYDQMHAYTVDAFVDAVRLYDKENLEDGYSSSLYIEDSQLLSICRLVRRQQGFWSVIPETYPENDLDGFIVLAELIACNLNSLTWGEHGNESDLPKETMVQEEPGTDS